MSTVDQEGYKVEAAMEVGFTPHPEEDDKYVCDDAQIRALVDRAFHAGQLSTLPIECDDNIAEAIALTANVCGGIAGDVWDAIIKVIGSRAGSGGFTVSKVAPKGAQSVSDTVHIMVDLETWGTTPGSDIRSIGAVVFDPVAGTLGDEFYVNVENPEERASFGCDRAGFEHVVVTSRYGLTRDPSTVEWWSKQSETAQKRLTTNVVDLKEGLFRFGQWWTRHGNCETTFWAHGPHFDEAILAACYRATGQPVPWHYRAPRDCRTAFEMAGDPCHVEFEGVEHDALADAKNQARRVIEAYRRVRSGGFTVSKVAHDQRVTELLGANNREVERRRAAESLLRSAAEGLENAASEASYHDNGAAYREYSGLALSIRKYFA